jgi:hypothetical protein
MEGDDEILLHFADDQVMIRSEGIWKIKSSGDYKTIRRKEN